MAFQFSVVTFGCRVNQADSADCERALMARGGERAPASSADLVVVNTCSVTSASDQAARQAIRRIARLNPRARIVAAGCYATRQPGDLASLPGVVCLVPNARKDELAGAACAAVGWPPAASREPRAGDALLRPGHNGRTTALLRVQTGCDERCSYCTIPATRGASRSRPLAEVLSAARELGAAGYKELVLTGVHLGAWGRDLSPAAGLIDLLRALDRLSGDLTYRISSLEPMDCPAGIVDLVAASGRFAPHFHLPLQHASDRVLAAMRRPYTLAGFRERVDRIRLAMPDAAIGSDVIAGFPGETGRDHDLLAGYLESSAVTHLHVFPYSDRPGTEAAGLGSKVPARVARERSDTLRTAARRLVAAFVNGQVGRVRPALTIEDGTRVVTDNYIKLQIPGGRARNERVRVLVTSGTPLRGKVVA